MDKLKQSPAEILKLVQIKPIEQECLDRVFNYLSKDNKVLNILCDVVEKGKQALNSSMRVVVKRRRNT
jgi:hypothetical protein